MHRQVCDPPDERRTMSERITKLIAALGVAATLALTLSAATDGATTAKGYHDFNVATTNGYHDY